MPVPPNWPSDRYDRRLGHRLRRRAFGRIDDPAPACPRADPPASPAPAAPGIDEAAARELAEAAERHREQHARLQAEFENFRRRARKEKEDMRQQAGAEVLEQLLPVLDNFQRALNASNASFDSFLEGIRMIHQHLGGILRNSGLETVDALGKPFDPNLHEAVAVDSGGEHPENHVVEVLQEGYSLRGRLLRPALVKVARSS